VSAYSRTLTELRAEPRTWLITGVAGFIGSHLLETLLQHGQRVVGLDNFSTGSPGILEDVRTRVSAAEWACFTMQRGSVADIGACREASNQVDYVLHHAGFVSVPLSIEDPVACHDTNVSGTLNLLIAARDNRVRRVVYASSSAVYGDDERVPKIETQIGRPLSPYGASKLIGELYARQFLDHYGLESIGLRYFNIFGTRQNVAGGYAAVIPQWIATMLRGEAGLVHGDGSATRDFCPVENVVQANLLAATTRERAALGEVYNVGLGTRTDLNTLYTAISKRLALGTPRPPQHGPPRAGDILHSGADITKIGRDLGFVPEIDLDQGLDETVRWYASGDRG
jgi:UDP-N-acetylglucosamine 4-epimerase